MRHGRPAAATGGRHPILRAAAACVTAALVACAHPAAAAARPAAPVTYPPLEELIAAPPQPRFVAAPAGPNNGPVTATTFAGLWPDPAQSTKVFDQLSASPGFAATIRVWTDVHPTAVPSGPAPTTAGGVGGQNDIADLVVRIPDAATRRSFESGLRPSSGSGTWSVPSIPGAIGTTEYATKPIAAVEQTVVFDAGIYVCLIQTASATGVGNPDPLTPADAIRMAYAQYGILVAAPGGVLPRPVTAPAGSPGAPVGLIVLLVVVVLTAVGGAAVFAARRYPERVPWLTDAVAATEDRIRALFPSAVTHPVPPRPVPSLELEFELEPEPEPVIMAVGSEPAPSAPTQPEAPPAAAVPAGWYADPIDPASGLRYWDGSGWTEHRAVQG